MVFVGQLGRSEALKNTSHQLTELVKLAGWVLNWLKLSARMVKFSNSQYSNFLNN
jgi:hypothetical protein